ncbi:MAG: MerR family transcriptional regulator [Acidobacteriota bacterium]
MTDQETPANNRSTLPKYKIGAASQLADLTVDVVRVWERRYQAITPQRTDGGSRLYSDADIARLRRLRQAAEMGHAISQIAKLPNEELETLAGRHRAALSISNLKTEQTAESIAEQTGDPHKIVRERFLAAIARMDVAAADQEIIRAATLYPPRLVIKNVIAPLLEEIGTLWTQRDFGTAEQHLAINLIRNLVVSLFRLYSPDESADAIVLATPAGEHQESVILISALIAAMQGWRVVYLGTDLPAAEIARTVRLTKASVLVLSIVSPENSHVAEELKAIADQTSPQASVLVSGAGSANHRALIEQANWIPVSDFEDLDDRLKR